MCGVVVVRSRRNRSKDVFDCDRGAKGRPASLVMRVRVSGWGDAKCRRQEKLQKGRNERRIDEK